MLQNRVDPFGNLIKTAARGSLMGNRGVIHNEKQEIIRPFKLHAWITCRLAFKGRKRKVMAPARWTELFFLDEATAFAAGHRPCAECRRDNFNTFKSLWIKANPSYGFNEKTSIKKIDEVLHQERTDRNNMKITFEEDAHAIPEAVFVLLQGNAYLLSGRHLCLWSPFGYEKKTPIPSNGTLTVLTPKSIVNTIRAGYLPQVAGKI
jgi:hypothetical protein